MKINRFFKLGTTILLVAFFACAPTNRAKADFPQTPRPNIPKPNIPKPDFSRPNIPRPERPDMTRPNVPRPDGAPVRRNREQIDDGQNSPQNAPQNYNQNAGQSYAQNSERPFVKTPTKDWVGDGFPLLFSRDYPVVNEIWEEFQRRENSGNLRPEADAVDFQLRNQGARYKGKLLNVRGRLLRAVETPTNGGKCYDLWILLPDSDKNPIRVLSLRAPNGFKTDPKLENEKAYDPDVKYRDENVELVGLYYRTTSFNAGDDIYAAPTLVALDFNDGKSASKSAGAPIAPSDSGASNGARRSNDAGGSYGSNASNNAGDSNGSKSGSDVPVSRYVRKGIRTIVFAALVWGWYIHSKKRGASRCVFLALCLTPGLAQAQDSAEFWAKATGSDLDAARREMNDDRPSLLDPAPEAAERRAFLVALIQRMNGALGVDVLRERSGDEYVKEHSLVEYVASSADAQPEFAPDADVRFYLGRLLDVAPAHLNEAEREKAGCPTIYRVLVELENSDARAILYTPSVPSFNAPDAFFDAADAAREDRRVAAIAVRFGRETEDGDVLSAAIAPRLGWYPVASPLARLGVDLSAFEKTPIYPPDALAKASDESQKRKIARSLRWTLDDRAPFYETLAASKRSDKLATRRVDSVAELFNRPQNWQGAGVRLRGWARRVNAVLVDDPIVKAELGIDQYYQIYFFTNDSQGRALVLCAAELPDGLNVGGGKEFRKNMEISGVFYKTWAFKKPASDDPSGKAWTSAPVVVGRVVDVEKDELAPAPPIAPSTVITLFAALAVAWIVMRRLVLYHEKKRSLSKLSQSQSLIRNQF